MMTAALPQTALGIRALSAPPPAYFQTFQVSTASISFLSSSTIAISIAFIGTIGLSTPYRRIIFGLSISDILQSLALLTGPVSVPPSKSSDDVGNETAACQMNGFFLTIGAAAVMMYTFFLCLYYVCKLKYRMSDDTFSYRIEKKFHIFIVVFTVVLNFAALTMDAFHTNPYFLSFCSFAAVPTRCRMDKNVGECDEAHMSGVMIFAFIETVALPLVCFVGIIITMGLLYQHAYVLNQNMENELSVPTSLRSAEAREEGGIPSPRSHTSSDNNVSTPEEDNVPQDRYQRLSRLFRREITIQATSYVGAFLLTYTPMVINSISAVFYLYPPVICAFQAFFWPLGGFLNILVYTRPKVASLRRKYPAYSRLRGFWLVLKAGGEIPDDLEASSSCCNCCRPPEWLESIMMILGSGREDSENIDHPHSSSSRSCQSSLFHSQFKIKSRV